MKDYKQLTRDEKIAKVLEYRVHRIYRNVKARYLIALRNNDKSALEYFECMGESLRVIIENTACFERAKACGFTEPHFDEYGWCRYKLKRVKEVSVYKSCVIIAKTPSGKFVYGVEHYTGTGGGGWWPSIWDNLHDTENNAIMSGLEYLKSRMERDLYRDRNSKIINATLREIDRLRKPVQLELF